MAATHPDGIVHEVRLIFYEEDRELLNELDAEVLRRKSSGDRGCSRLKVIKERLVQGRRTNEGK